MNQFWLPFAGAVTGVLIGLWLIQAHITAMVWRLKFRKIMAQQLRKSAPVEMMTLLKKITGRDYLESLLRAKEGKPIARPFGMSMHLFHWEQFQFNPVYYFQKPLAADVPIQTEVILGPLAQRPLKLNTPIMISGMSYGSALSLKAQAALAKAAALIGTCANTGSGPFLEETRGLVKKYTLQLSRGYWSRSEDILRRIDMIEISLGHGAWGSAPVRISGKEVTNGFAQRIGAIPGLDVLLESRLPEVESQGDWKALIKRLKEVTGGVPIAVKIGGTHYIERELELLLEGGIDVLVLDGAEGGTHACPVILLDDVGLPTLPSLCRAVKFFERNQLKGKVSLVISGGLVAPGDFLKCLALGADAIAIGTVATLAMTHTQVTKATPWEPPTQVIYYGAKKEAMFNPDLGAKHLANFFASCLGEMKMAARSLGKADLRMINKDDLVALDPLYAEMAGVTYAGNSFRGEFEQ